MSNKNLPGIRTGYIKSIDDILQMPGWWLNKYGNRIMSTSATQSIYHPCGRCLDYDIEFIHKFMGTGLICSFKLGQKKGVGSEYRELWKIINDRWCREVYSEMIIDSNPLGLEPELFEI